MVNYQCRGPVEDRELTALHAAAFGRVPGATIPFQQRLVQHSLTWITARDSGALVGFINVIGDGGAHAVLLDTVVAPGQHGNGIGTALVRHAVAAARDAGCEWAHVDYEPGLAGFYEQSCGFRPTAAGVLRLR